ncbi:MAG TPA: type II secretion system F family protein [Candidatus Portnoybacteria bacterium]|nr:type II secretion system F family protein [Candidatus Portnoybacteria bacterium]
MIIHYVVKNKKGEMQEGKIKALNKREAFEFFQKDNLIVLSLEEEGKSVLGQEITIFNRVSNKEIVIFTRQLATTFSAKVALAPSLNALSKNISKQYFKRIITNLAADIESGTAFSKALSKYPKVFSRFYISMVKIGETSGSLDLTLNHLADYLEKQYYLNAKVKSAMFYPIFILVALIGAIVVIMVYIVPKIVPIIESSGSKLPASTQMLISLSNFTRAYGWWILAISILIITGLVYLIKKNQRARYYFDLSKLKMPILGSVFQKFYINRIVTNLQILIKGGIPILSAIETTADTTNNLIYQKIMQEASRRVKAGQTISSVFYQYPDRIPVLVSQMISTGEQTGRLEIVLEKISDFYTREVDNVVDSISELIQPLLILILGGGVAFLAISVIMPIYNMTSAF